MRVNFEVKIVQLVTLNYTMVTAKIDSKMVVLTLYKKKKSDQKRKVAKQQTSSENQNRKAAFCKQAPK